MHRQSWASLNTTQLHSTYNRRSKAEKTNQPWRQLGSQPHRILELNTVNEAVSLGTHTRAQDASLIVAVWALCRLLTWVAVPMAGTAQLDVGYLGRTLQAG